MGYYIVLDVNLTVADPKALIESVLRDRPHSIIDGPDVQLEADDIGILRPDYRPTLLTLYQAAFGPESDHEWLPSTPGHTAETIWMRVSDVRHREQLSALTYLAEHGVTGTVEVTGEDGDRWRWSVADGELVESVGEFVYSATLHRMEAADALLDRIDWAQLREQKLCLLSVLGPRGQPPHVLDGLVHLLDALQDHAVAVRGLPEAEVFSDADVDVVSE